MGIMFCGDVSWLCAVHHRHMPWGLGNGGGRERVTYGGDGGEWNCKSCGCQVVTWGSILLPSQLAAAADVCIHHIEQIFL